MNRNDHSFLAEAELVTARHELEMRDMDRRLREEQDLEFQRTMEADRKRIEEENKKKQEEEDKIRAAEEKANERIRRVTEHRVGNFIHFQPEFKVDIFLSDDQFCIFFSKLVRDIDLILFLS